MVASVELGNTTIKSILTATDLIEGHARISVGEIIADGCLKAGIPPRKMAGAMRKVDLLELEGELVLAGRASNGEEPYANVIWSYCGLVGAIFDALARPAADIPESYVEDMMSLIKIKREG